MSRDLKNQFRDLAERVMICFRNTQPSRQFIALLSLSVIWLGVLTDREANTENPEERRCIEDEFEQGKGAVERGMEMLYGQARRSSGEVLLGTCRTLRQMRRTDAADRALLDLSGLR